MIHPILPYPHQRSPLFVLQTLSDEFFWAKVKFVRISSKTGVNPKGTDLSVLSPRSQHSLNY